MSRDSARAFPIDERVRVGVGGTAAGGWMSLTRVLRLPACAAQVRALVRDVASGLGGTVTQRLEVPALDEPFLATPILTDRMIAFPRQAPRFVPVAYRRFKLQGLLYCSYEVVGMTNASGQATTHVTGGFTLRGSAGQIVRQASPTPIGVALGGKVRRVLDPASGRARSREGPRPRPRRGGRGLRPRPPGARTLRAGARPRHSAMLCKRKAASRSFGTVPTAATISSLPRVEGVGQSRASPQSRRSQPGQRDHGRRGGPRRAGSAREGPDARGFHASRGRQAPGDRGLRSRDVATAAPQSEATVTEERVATNEGQVTRGGRTSRSSWTTLAPTRFRWKT